jgi:hypothetical protein
VEKRTVVDAGPIIALLIGADKHYGWGRIYRRNRRQIIPLLAPPGM